MKQIISLQIESELYEIIKLQADNEGISASAVIRRLLKNHFQHRGVYYNEHQERQNITTVADHISTHD